jgi:hypothetical protein
VRATLANAAGAPDSNTRAARTATPRAVEFDIRAR